MKRTSKGILIVILLAAMAAGSCYLIRFYHSFQTSQAEQSYYKADEIAEHLKAMISPYQKCTATIEIDTDTLIYSMEDLGQRIFFRCPDKKEFETGEERKLADYILKKNWDIENADISIQCECNETTLQEVTEKLSKRYNQSPQNSRISKSGKILPAKHGNSFDTTELTKGLRTYLNRQTTNNYTAAYETSVIDAKWTFSDIKKVNTSIASYTTHFKNNTDRGYNIRLAAKRLDKTFLLPGESISFLDILYDDSDKKSYRKSSAYYKGKVVLAEGGGICQVSTTAYHAFLLAGIIPEKRYPHSMTVGYAKPGLDAALSVGGKDLVIKNTLDVPLFIRAKAKKGVLTISILSYSNALKGYTYKPDSQLVSAYEAKSYLTVYKKNKKIKTISLSHDFYQKKGTSS